MHRSKMESCLLGLILGAAIIKALPKDFSGVHPRPVSSQKTETNKFAREVNDDERIITEEQIATKRRKLEEAGLDIERMKYLMKEITSESELNHNERVLLCLFMIALFFAGVSLLGILLSGFNF